MPSATRLVEEFYGQKAEYVATERTLRLADYTLKSLAQIEMDIRAHVDSGYYFIIETKRLLKTSTDVVPAMTLAMRGPCWCLVGLSASFPDVPLRRRLRASVFVLWRNVRPGGGAQ